MNNILSTNKTEKEEFICGNNVDRISVHSSQEHFNNNFDVCYDVKKLTEKYLEFMQK